MVRIMLACAAGMSTSLLVTKMEKETAADAGVEAKIWAVPESEVEKNIGEFDILLVGPQIRFKAKAFEKMSAGRFPVHVIDMRDYGTMNGGKVFATAMEILGK